MYTICVDSYFWACHSVPAADGPAEPVHCHNFCAAAQVGAEKPDEKGMVADFCLLKKKLDKITAGIAEKGDIGQIEYFAENGQTAEVIAGYIYKELAKSWQGEKRLMKVTVTEEPPFRACFCE